jgi:hypothetical protein
LFFTGAFGDFSRTTPFFLRNDNNSSKSLISGALSWI